MCCVVNFLDTVQYYCAAWRESIKDCFHELFLEYPQVKIMFMPSRQLYAIKTRPIWNRFDYVLQKKLKFFLYLTIAQM
jgi:hypothetical protein